MVLRSRTTGIVVVSCLRCRHRGVIEPAALERLGFAPDAPISSFIKRVRCSQCGSGSVMAKRSQRPEAPKRRRA